MTRTPIAVLFPPPDHPHQTKVRIEVVGAAIIQVQTSPVAKNAAVSATAREDDALVNFRFMVPLHTRVLRDFFKAAKVKRWEDEIRRGPQSYGVQGGAFLVAFEGRVLGTDNIPEGVKFKPKESYVMDEVTVRGIPTPA
jgi:hypothetical protein